jgi:hypothetical protein
MGCPRSGTTLLRRLFDAHKDFSCPGESFVLRGATRFLSSETVAEGIDYGPFGGLTALGFSRETIEARVRDMALSFHAEIAKTEGKSRTALKTAVDSFYAREIFELFQGHAKFVFLIRHGADVALSLRDFSEKMEGIIEELMPFVVKHRRTLAAFAHAWVKVTTDMLDLAEAHDESVFALRYEDLIEEPRAALSEMWDFVGAPCDVDALLTETFKPREVHGLGDYKTFGTDRIHALSCGRWQTLADRVKSELAPILNPVLKRAGYDEIQTSDTQSDAMRLHELAMMFQSTRGKSGDQDG